MKHSIKHLTVLGLALAVCPALLSEKTRTWHQTSGADFEKGTAEGVAISSDGTLSLAPKIAELYESPAAYLGAIATDSKGNVYVSGGPDARVYRIPAAGDAGELFFEADAVDIRALAFDADDNLYAAVSPEAKVYKVTPDGESEEIYEPGGDYVWAMAFDSQNRLYLATGDKGEIHRISTEGDGSLFFETNETHVRSLLVDGNDDLIVGTDPSGLVMRVSIGDRSEPEGFVLYQSSRAEITAVVRGEDGTIYAAGVGNRTTRPARRTPTPAATPRPAARTAPAGGTTTQQQSTTPAPTRTAPAALLARVIGGSTIYAIAPDGEPREIWSSGQTIVYSLTVDSAGRLLAGTGDKGRLIRVDSAARSTILTTRASKQITALALSGQRIIAATSNIGSVFAVGPELEEEGVFESQIHDASRFSKFGRIEWKGAAASVLVRSGNLNSPERNWSDWSAASDANAGVAGIPGARFAQWKAVLRAEGDTAPELRSATLYYQPKNSAPRISAVAATPPNYRFPPRTATARTVNITLRPLGSDTTAGRSSTTRQVESMMPAPGHIGVRWKAEDPNSDDLSARLEIQGESETTWIVLEKEITGSHHSWDSTAFADGWYRARATVTDQPSNPGPDAMSDSMTSEPFLIDNSAPTVTQLAASIGNERVRASFTAADIASKIAEAEYSLNGDDWKLLLPTSGLFDSPQAEFEFDAGPAGAGQHVVAVRVRDSQGNVAVTKTTVSAAE